MARKKISSKMLNKLAVGGAKVTKKSSSKPKPADPPVTQAAPLPPPPPPPPAQPQAAPNVVVPPPQVVVMPTQGGQTEAPKNESLVPMASMASSMAEINRGLGDVIERNTKAIEGIKSALEKQPKEAPTVKNMSQQLTEKRRPWRAKIVRGQSKLIDYVDIIPMEIKR